MGEQRSSSRRKRPTAVYLLLLVNLAVSFAATFLGQSILVFDLYLHHGRYFRQWQLLTSCFCHGNRNHLSSNMFLLLLFGRSVEDDWGFVGLLLSYCFCGIVSNLISIALLPSSTVSLGASGAVFGLFTVSILAKLSGGFRRILDWRQWIELLVLGDFVWRELISEIATAARGEVSGVDHVAHFGGALAGASLVWGMRMILSRFEEKNKRIQRR